MDRCGFAFLSDNVTNAERCGDYPSRSAKVTDRFTGWLTGWVLLAVFEVADGGGCFARAEDRCPTHRTDKARIPPLNISQVVEFAGAWFHGVSLRFLSSPALPPGSMGLAVSAVPQVHRPAVDASTGLLVRRLGMKKPHRAGGAIF